MSVLDRCFALDVSITDLQNPDLWLQDWAAGGSTKSTAGETVSPEKALGLSTYYECIRVISEDVAKLPLKTYRRLPRGKQVDPRHQRYRILHDAPNNYQSSFTFRETLTSWALGWGGGFAEIAWLPGDIVEGLYPIHPSRVGIFVNPDFSLQYVIRNNDGTVHGIPAWRMLHIHGLGPDGRVGYSVCRVACESLGLGLAMQKFGASFFGNGAALTGILEHPSHFRDEEKLNRLRKQWSEMYQGAGKACKTAILEDGMKFSKISVPPEEAQFLESRQFQLEEICRWFRVPPHKVQHLLRATFSNIEHQSIEYSGDTMLPWTSRWEQEIQRKLFVGDENHFAEFKYNALLRTDQTTRGQFYRVMVELGALSPNEVRELENMNPVEGGDQHFRPGNLLPLAQPLPQPASPEIAQPEMPMKEEPQQEPDESPEESPPPEIGASTWPVFEEQMRSGFEPLFLDAARRVVRKELADGIRALESHKGNEPRFREWEKKFFGDHGDFIASTFEPAASALAAILGRDKESIDLRAAASRHAEEVRRRLGEAFDRRDGSAISLVACSMKDADIQAVELSRMMIQEV